MDFGYTPDQEQFRASLRRHLADHPWRPEGSETDAAQVRGQDLADLGVYAALLPEADGGFGFGTVGGTVIAEELGRAVLATPLIETAAVAGGLIAALGSPEQKARWLPSLAAGGTTIALATGLTAGAPLDCGATVQRDGAGFVCSGAEALVVGGRDAEHILMVVPFGDGNRAVFVVDRAALSAGFPFRTVDGLAAATFRLDDLVLSPAMLIGRAGMVDDALADCLDRAVTLQCAELQGLMATLINRTLEHLRSRRQFGVALIEFQSLQHRLADMLLAYEQATSLTLRAAAMCDTAAPGRGHAVAAAKVQATRSAMLVGNEAIQMHGAIGMTEELIVGSAAKRIRALAVRLGSSQFHLDAFRSRDAPPHATART